MTRGFIIAAPSSGSGKTTVTLGLLRALRNKGTSVSSIKVGPDYIDPAFHAAASGRPCINLDPWAMRPTTLQAYAEQAGEESELIVGEGVMGLFDGAADGRGSTADLAVELGWPVVLVVDVTGQGASVAALVAGFRDHHDELSLAGVILNQVGSLRHENILRQALSASGCAVLGALHKDQALHLPSRHLGLVQAGERQNLERFLDSAADAISRNLDLDVLQTLAQPTKSGDLSVEPDLRGLRALPPLGQELAIARDEAFSFLYDAQLTAWRQAGVSIRFFSPLADEAPDLQADAVVLPGGYPELHAGRLAANDKFVGGLRQAVTRGAVIYGECGGYMTLGQGLVDAKGVRHAMAGLLPLETSFAERRRHLGYRVATTLEATPLGPVGSRFRGHEFHYTTCRLQAEGQSWLSCRDAQGAPVDEKGLRQGNIFGSFIHMIDQAEEKDSGR